MRQHRAFGTRLANRQFLPRMTCRNRSVVCLDYTKRQALTGSREGGLHGKPPSLQRVSPHQPTPKAFATSSCGIAHQRGKRTRSCAIVSHYMTVDVATKALFVSSTTLAAALTALMIFFPRWKKAQKLVYSQWPLLLIASTYGLLLCWSWQPDNLSLILPGNLADGFKNGWTPQFFPNLSGIVLLFSRVGTAVSLWVHLLGVNLFAARSIFIDGR